LGAAKSDCYAVGEGILPEGLFMWVLMILVTEIAIRHAWTGDFTIY
jgi:hypothetical protein